MPQSRSAQYILHWYVSETLPEDVEDGMSGAAAVGGETRAGGGRAYVRPPAFPEGLSLKARIALDKRVSADGGATVYEPRKHEGTGVDEEEALYESFLVPVEEARKRLRGSVTEDVVRRGWEAVRLRMEIEEGRT